MAIAIDGLSSSLDTTALINGLMQHEAIPQTLLKKKASGTQSMVSALQQLNTRIASLGTLAKDTAKPAALDLFTATTSSDAISATVRAGASVASLGISVDSLAQAQVSVTEPLTAWNGTAVTITGADGDTTITAASASLDDVVAAINDSDAGVTALKVAAGTNGDGDPQYRLQLTAKTTGAASAFSLTGPVTSTQVTAAQDAVITLWAGTAAEQSITSATNTFTNVLPEVDLTVRETSTAPVRLTVARDSAASAKVAEDFVGAINGVLAMISTRTAVTHSTDAAGKPVLSSGVFTGDSTVRTANQNILSAASAPVNGISPSSVGISITKTGAMEFDRATFDAALAADPQRVQSMVQALAERVASAADAVSNKHDGLITSKITGQETLVRNINTQIEEWDARLASRRATLERTFVAMEVRLGTINSQSAWLTSQLASLAPAKEK